MLGFSQRLFLLNNFQMCEASPETGAVFNLCLNRETSYVTQTATKSVNSSRIGAYVFSWTWVG